MGLVKKGAFDKWHVKVSKESNFEVKKMRIWCHNNSTCPWSFEMRGIRNNLFTANFVFDNELDAIFFALKWA